MVQIPKGRLVKDPFKPMCSDCAIYFSILFNYCNDLWKKGEALVGWVRRTIRNPG